MTAVLDTPGTTGAPRTALTPRPHQTHGITELDRVFTRSPRAQLHWACGTGKTLEARWYAQHINAQTAVVYAPSLALVAQILAEWQAAGRWAFDPLIVCSDPTTADAWQVDGEFWTSHHAKVTTDAADVTRFLINRRTGRARVVFSTYHSAPIVSRGQQRCRVIFDLAVLDEAHNLAGQPDPRFRVVLDDRKTYARRRLFTTATPVIARTDPDAPWDTLSMDDAAQFGPVADRVDIPAAIAAGLLVDYQVVVLDASDVAASLAADQQVPAALIAASRLGLSRVISFHGRVEKARAFTDAAHGLTLPDGRTVDARTIAGSDPTSDRRAALARLRTGHPARVTVVGNARCLSEGVDVPGVDGVVFADQKQSPTDIVQAIGRALRPAPGKTHGTIILPVVLPEHADADLLLSSGPFAAVYAVLRALRAVDSRMATEIDQLYRPPQRPGTAGPGVSPDRPLLRFDLPDGIDLGQLAARIVALDTASNGAAWDRMLDVLRSYANEHRHTAILPAAVHDGMPLGNWVNAQRAAYAAGALAADRVTRLDAIPHWGWTVDSARWSVDHGSVLAIATRFGLDLASDIAGAQLANRTGKTARRKTVGRWCAEQRIARRDGLLSDRRAAACETIPGWTWTAGLDRADTTMVGRLAEWVHEHGDATPDPATAGPGYDPQAVRDLAAWCGTVRVRAVAGVLPQPLADEIAAVTPTGPDAKFHWAPNDTRWKLHLAALRQFIARTGGVSFPEHHIEPLPVPGGTFDARLYDWAARMRHQRRHGDLDPAKEADLDAVPQWQWEKTRVQGSTLAADDPRHGTRRGYAAGCTLGCCTAANTAYEASRRAAAATGESTTSRVDDARARAHLRMLEPRCGWRARTAFAEITGLNPKTIDAISNGERVRGIMPEVEADILALTVDAVKAWLEVNPSPRDPFPAAPTLALIDTMHYELGWPKAWIARELGLAGPGLQMGRAQPGGTGATVHRRNRDAVQALYDRLAGRRCPSRAGRTSFPPLTDIIATETPERAAS